MVLTSFREKLEDLINNSGLTIEAVYFVLKDVMGEITTLYQNTTIEEKIETQKKQAEENEKRIMEENEKLAQKMQENVQSKED